MFDQQSFTLMYKAIKYVYNSIIKEVTTIREHVLNMIIHFNATKLNGYVINESSQVSFIMESLPKSFLLFTKNALMNKIEYNLTSLLNEFQFYQSLLKTKWKEGEVNVTTSKRLDGEIV